MFIPGSPIAADGRTFDEAVTELIGALREYAEDWRDRLHDTPGHRQHRGLVRLISRSDDDRLREWLAAEVHQPVPGSDARG
ncbi:hypothetical protein GCM10009850_105610 [Nonomuraea monospora]|uniref:Uncharacterized protein n=1 Tax=Nonomuraea monospora TaxID=568818 RepID=A0ABN3D027_9ACTN